MERLSGDAAENSETIFAQTRAAPREHAAPPNRANASCATADDSHAGPQETLVEFTDLRAASRAGSDAEKKQDVLE